MLQNNFFINIIFSFFAIVLNFWFKSYLAFEFAKVELGIYYTLIDIVSIFMIIFVGARSSMVVHFAKTNNETMILNLFKIALGIVFIIASLFLVMFYEKIFDSSINKIFLVMFVLAQAIYIFFFNQLSMYKLYKLTNIVTLIEPITLIGVFFILKVMIGLSFEQLLLSTIFDMFILALIMKIGKNKNEPPFALVTLDNSSKQFINNSLLASFEFFVGMLSVYLAVLFFAKYFGVEHLADFQVVVKPIYFYFLTLFVFPIFKFVFPEVSQMASQKNYTQIKAITTKITIYAFVVSIVSMALLIFFGKNLVLYFFGEAYINSVFMLQITAIVFSFVIFTGYFTSVLKAFGKFKETLFIRIFGLIVFGIVFYSTNLFINNPITIIFAFICGHIAICGLLYYKYKAILKSYQP